jgi:hypothetical protein
MNEWMDEELVVPWSNFILSPPTPQMQGEGTGVCERCRRKMTSAGVQGGFVGWPATYSESGIWRLRGVVSGKNKLGAQSGMWRWTPA